MSAPQPQGRPPRSLHPLAPWFDYVPPGLASTIRQLLQDLNTQAADMVASDNEAVQEQGRELARRVLSEPYLAAAVAPPQSREPGFWDQVAADADAVAERMAQVKAAATSCMAHGWYAEDVSAVLRLTHESAQALVRIRTNAERADRVGANVPDLAIYPRLTVQKG